MPIPTVPILVGALLFDAGTAVSQAPGASEPQPIRIGLRVRGGAADRLTPLRYLGGFETKTLLYETLVRRGADGRLVPALADWRIAPDGRSVRFTIRPGARFQDGSPVTAQAVRTHFRRWVGLPEHDWLRANRHIVDVVVENDDTLVVQLDEPYPLLADLTAINPCAIVAPAARDWEGEFVRPLGSGAFRFAGTTDGGGFLLQAGPRADGRDGPLVEIVPMPRSNLEPSRDLEALDALAAGRLDAFVGAWDEDLPAARLDALADDPRFVVQAVPGSAVVYLSFRGIDGPTADVDVRRRIAAAVDRDALVADVEGGRAEPCASWAAPAVKFWPRAPLPQPAPTPGTSTPRVALRIAAGRLNPRALRTARAVQAQLAPHGFDVEVVEFDPRATAEAALAEQQPAVRPQTVESGAVRAATNRELRRRAETADLCVEITHGMPYDPQQTLVSRWAGLANENEDEPRPETAVDAELQALVRRTLTIADELQCVPVYAEIQARMTREALVVPLFSPNHVAVRRVEIEGLGIGPDLYRIDLADLHRSASPR